MTPLLVEEAQGEMRTVFTENSLARVHSRVLIGFMLLQLGGSLALAGAALLLNMAGASL